MEETIVTDDALISDSDTSVKTDGLETEIKTDEGTPPDGVTVPQKSDADTTKKADVEDAKLAWNLRNERRARKEAEERIAVLEAKIVTPAETRPKVPLYEDFESISDYNEAVASYHENLFDWKIKQREQEVNIQTVNSNRREEMRKLDDTYNEKAAKAIEKYSDYIDVVEKSPFTYAMEEAIKKSENSAEIAYHISKNPEIQGKLLNSSPIDVAIEIHKLDLKFTQGLNQKRVSSAPSPITPVNSEGAGVEKDPSKMSDDEYFTWDKARKVAAFKKKQERFM